MTEERWKKIIDKVEQKFGIIKRYQEDFLVDETSQSEKIYGKKDIILFKSPLGKIKLELIKKPRVLDRKVLHSKRIGGRVAMNYVYSKEDFVSRLEIYKENEKGEWEIVMPNSFNI